MLFLLPALQESVEHQYSAMDIKPIIYPYDIQIVEIRRINGFRGFHFEVVADLLPSTGAHNAIGHDRVSLGLTPGPSVRIIRYEHHPLCASSVMTFISPQ